MRTFLNKCHCEESMTYFFFISKIIQGEVIDYLFKYILKMKKMHNFFSFLTCNEILKKIKYIFENSVQR